MFEVTEVNPFPVWPLKPAWKGVIERAKRAAERERMTKAGSSKLPIPHNKATAFGAGAFTEALFRVAFTYLGFYGTSQQQSMSGFVRAVWLLTYLRSVAAHLRRSLDGRAASAGPYVCDIAILYHIDYSM